MTKLLEVPNHEFMESPSSWLTRVALGQVVTPRELADHLDVNLGVDCEMALARTSFDDLAGKLSKTGHSFKGVDSVMRRLRKIDPNGERYLLRHRSIAFHRFCAACLATDNTKYFRLEWRFKCWRWCPLHSCLLRERCPHCDKLVKLPRNMFRAGPDGLGIATLERCLDCGQPLTTGWKAFVDSLGDEVTTEWEKVLLRNGRSVLAALATGRLRIEGEQKDSGFMQLRKIERLGYLPHINFRLTHNELVRRQIEESHEVRRT